MTEQTGVPGDAETACAGTGSDDTAQAPPTPDALSREALGASCWCGRDEDVCEENGGCRWSAAMGAAEARTAAAELRVTLLRVVLLEGGQDDATARRRALAIIGTEGEASRACSRCEGCGRLADTDDREPWVAWTSLPLEAQVAVHLGIVKPVPCDVCGGTGRVPEAQERSDEKGAGRG